MKDWFTYLTYSALWKLLRVLPESVAYGLFRVIAKLAYVRNGKRTRRLRSNYQKVAPHLSNRETEVLVREGLGSAMRYWCDTFRISDWSKERIVSTVTTRNEDFLLSPVREKRGVIVALPHAGNWDHAGAYFCALGVRVNTVAEHLKPEKLFRKFLVFREEMGMRVLDINSGVIDTLTEMLNTGELVALAADRDLSKSGINVNFFNSTARMPAGPALLAYETGADLITAYVSYREQGIEITFTPPVSVNRTAEKKEEVARVTQVLASRFQDAISLDPQSWHMQQRIFIDGDFVERS
jgi:KDO2-lipid IV(A) lauroyltransferase